MQTTTSSGRAPAIVFANSKGGVGKSTLAFLSTLYLAAHGKRLCFIDLDKQKTGEACLARFAEGDRITLAEPDEELALPQEFNGGGGFDPTAGIATGGHADFFVVDTPAGLDAGNLDFLQSGDLVLLPCSESDLDLAATRRFLQQILPRRADGWSDGVAAINASPGRGHARASLYLAPNLVEDESGYRRIKAQLSMIPAMPPVYYTPGIRRALRRQDDDLDVIATLQANDAFFHKLLAWSIQQQISRLRGAQSQEFTRAATAFG